MISLAYLFEANLCLLLLLGFYRLCLARLTFFGWNRFYLVAGLVSSLFIPLMRVPAPDFQWTPTGDSTVSILVAKAVILSQPSTYTITPSKAVSAIHLFSALYWLVVGFHGIKLFKDIYSVWRLAHQYPSQRWESKRLIWAPDFMPTSSFFHYIFLNKTQLQPDSLEIALRHEQAHSQQWHTIDWLLIRVVSAVFWFNPLLRYWKKEIALNHEYLADSQAVKTCGSYQYAHLLVRLAANSTSISTLHYFSYGQLKSRITMLHQLRSNAILRMRFLGVVPLVCLMIALLSCERSINAGWAVSSTLAKGSFMAKELIGTWNNLSIMTINDDDGKTPRGFPRQPGDFQACGSKLVLEANGGFQMWNHETDQRWSGTWQSDQGGTVVQLHYVDRNVSRNGSVPKGPALKTIQLDITSLKGSRFEAQHFYPANDQLSGGTIIYEYQKE